MTEIKVVTSDNDKEFEDKLNNACREGFVIQHYQFIESAAAYGPMHSAILEKKGD